MRYPTALQAVDGVLGILSREEPAGTTTRPTTTRHEADDNERPRDKTTKGEPTTTKDSGTGQPSQTVEAGQTAADVSLLFATFFTQGRRKLSHDNGRHDETRGQRGTTRDDKDRVKSGRKRKSPFFRTTDTHTPDCASGGHEAYDAGVTTSRLSPR